MNNNLQYAIRIFYFAFAMGKQLHALWQGKGKKITVNLPYIIFEDGGFQIVFCPALDLSGYGKTEDEAKKSFSIVLNEYFSYTTNKGTLADDLTSMGWIVKKQNLTKPPTPPDLSYTLSSNDDFRRIFDNYNFKKGQTEVAIPAMC